MPAKRNRPTTTSSRARKKPSPAAKAKPAKKAAARPKKPPVRTVRPRVAADEEERTFFARVPAAVDAAAFAAVMQWIDDRRAALAAVGFDRAAVARGRMAYEAVRRGIERVGAAPAPEPSGVREVAFRRLQIARDSIRRKTVMPRDAALRRRFGLDVECSVHAAESIAAAIRAFLAGAAQERELLHRACILPDKLARLGASLAALEAQAARALPTPADARAALHDLAVAHEALEEFYSDFAVAVNAAFEEDEEARIAGLKLVPRERDRRPGGAPR
jgi:hypothetical protein